MGQDRAAERIRVRVAIMSLTVTELAEEVRESNKRLTAATQELRTDLRDFRKEFVELRLEGAKINTSLRWAKAIGTVLAGAALTGLWYTYQAVRHVTALEASVAILQQDSAQIKGVVLALQKDTAVLQSDSKARDAQFSKALESLDRIEKALAQGNRARQ